MAYVHDRTHTIGLSHSAQQVVMTLGDEFAPSAICTLRVMGECEQVPAAVIY